MSAVVERRPAKLIEGTTGSWEIVIGMEVHAQVLSKAKLFSGAATAFGARVTVLHDTPVHLPFLEERQRRQARIAAGLHQLQIFFCFVIAAKYHEAECRIVSRNLSRPRAAVAVSHFFELLDGIGIAIFLVIVG